MSSTNPPALPAHWSLTGRNIVVTGGSRGIGLAATRELLSLGANVAIISRNQQHLEALLPQLQTDFPDSEIRALATDLAYPESLGNVVSWITQDWSKLHGLVNNVGTNIRKPAIDVKLEEYYRLMDANLTSCFELSRLCHPLLKSAGNASVVNVSSVAGLTHLRTGPVYAMTKAAMNQLTKNLCCEWASDGIRVNAVAPWYIATELAQQVLKDDDYRNQVLSRTPMDRVGEPREVGSAIAFLISPAAGYISGECLAVDGGFLKLGF